MLKLPSPFKQSGQHKKEKISAHRIESIEVNDDVIEEATNESSPRHQVAHQSSVEPPNQGPTLPAITVSTVKSTSTSQSMKSHGRGFPSLFSSIRRARGNVFSRKGKAKKSDSRYNSGVSGVQEISFKARNSSSIKLKAGLDSNTTMDRKFSEKGRKGLLNRSGQARKKSFTETIAATISFLKVSTTGNHRSGSVKRS